MLHEHTTPDRRVCRACEHGWVFRVSRTPRDGLRSNARAEPRAMAGATQERRLLRVGSSAMFGPASAGETQKRNQSDADPAYTPAPSFGRRPHTAMLASANAQNVESWSNAIPASKCS